MSEQSQIRTLVEAFLEDAKAHKGRDGKSRGQNTLNGYREAARRFADAVEIAGYPLDRLPPDFLHAHWLQQMQHRWHQPVQLRVRAFAVQGLVRWLREHGIPVPELIPVKVQTPDARLTAAGVTAAVVTAEQDTEAPPEEENMPQPILSDITLDDPTAGGDVALPPMPQQTYQPVQTQLPMQPVQAMQPMGPRSPPPFVQMPMQRPVAAVAAQPPRPAAKPNPLAHLLPTAGYRLRVRRERDLEEPVWVGDYPAEQVVVHGAIEPFLAKVAASKLPGVMGDVTFQVCPVGPDGREGERSRVTIAVQATAPTAGPTPPMMPMQGGGGSLTEMADMLALQRRALEEAESRIAGQVQQQMQAANNLGGIPNYGQQSQQWQQPQYQQPYQQPVAGPADDLRNAVQEMQRVMGLMAERVAELSNPQPQPQVQQPPQLDILAVIDRIGGMMRSNQPAEPPKSAAGSMGEVFTMMAQAKEIFAPSNVNVDVSPLEDELKNVRAELAAVKNQGAKKDELLEFAEKVKALQSLFGGAGPFNSGGAAAGQPAKSSIGSALGGLIEKVIENPEPVASAIERVLNGVARVKESAVTQEMAKPPPTVPGQGLDPRVKRGVEALLAANGDGAIVTAAMELVQTLNVVESTKPIAEQIAKRLQAGNEVELVAFLRQVFTRLGYGAQATPARVGAIVAAVFKQIRASQAAAAGEQALAQEPAAEDADEPEDEDDGDEEGDEDSAEDDEEGDAEEEEGDEYEMEPDPEQRTRGSTLNIRVGGTRELEPEEDAELLEEVEEIEEPPPPKRRNRRRKDARAEEEPAPVPG